MDAQNGWPEIVAAANTTFENAHPGWTVNVQYQQWSTHLQKFDATIAGNDTPDVIEMGNTEMTKYMAAGAFANLGANKGQFDELRVMALGPEGLVDVQRKLFGVPYYAGSRVITYRSDLFRKAGYQEAADESLQFQTSSSSRQDGEARQGFAPLYVGGEDWYTALSFVFDYGGSSPS